MKIDRLYTAGTFLSEFASLGLYVDIRFHEYISLLIRRRCLQRGLA